MNTEKEWFDNGIFKGDFREELISLLEQQKKRDWKEFRGMVENQLKEEKEHQAETPECTCSPNDPLYTLVLSIDAKLAELNNPKE